MSFKEIKDERLELQKYKAGYETFKILIFINFAAQLILITEFGYENLMIYIASLPFFLGLWIYEFKAQEAEEFTEEQKVLKATAQRQQWIVIAKRIAFMGIGFGLIQYFTGDENIEKVFIQGIMFAIAMGIFEYFQMRSVLKKNKEKENDENI